MNPLERGPERSEPRRLERPELLDLYRAAQDIRKYHHQALWEIEKHFTWWSSVILGASLVLLNAQGLEDRLKFLVLIAIAGLGLLISLIGVRVVRREGEYFWEAVQTSNRIGRVLGLGVVKYPELGDVPDPTLFRDYPVESFESASARPRLISVLVRVVKHGGVRDHFQVVLLGCAFMFVLLMGLSASALSLLG